MPSYHETPEAQTPKRRCAPYDSYTDFAWARIAECAPPPGASLCLLRFAREMDQTGLDEIMGPRCSCTNNGPGVPVMEWAESVGVWGQTAVRNIKVLERMGLVQHRELKTDTMVPYRVYSLR